MEAPSYLMPRPPLDLNDEKCTAFDRLYIASAKTPQGKSIDYDLPYPKWHFLSYLGEMHDIVLHGSWNKDISRIEPQRAQDVRAFSAQRAIYATTDGIWAIFFAILDRKNHTLGLFNSCLQARLPTGELSEPLYFFSINDDALKCRPWSQGAVYMLPKEHFEQEPPQRHQGIEVVFPHWIGKVETVPVAKLIVGPDDFPFLKNVRGHNQERLLKRMSEDPDGFPWLE